MRAPFAAIDIERHPEAAELVTERNGGMRKVSALDVEGTTVSGDGFRPARFETDLRAAGVL